MSVFPWERTEGEGPARGRATSGQSLAPPAGARIKLGQLPASQPCDPNCLPRASPAARAATASSPHRPPCVRESVCRRARASRGDAEGGQESGAEQEDAAVNRQSRGGRRVRARSRPSPPPVPVGDPAHSGCAVTRRWPPDGPRGSQRPPGSRMQPPLSLLTAGLPLTSTGRPPSSRPLPWGGPRSLHPPWAPFSSPRKKEFPDRSFRQGDVSWSSRVQPKNLPDLMHLDAEALGTSLSWLCPPASWNSSA